MNESDARSIQQALIFASITAFAVVVTGLAGLAGWAFDQESLKSVIPGYIPMMPNTAVAFLAAGASLGLSGPWRRSEVATSPRTARALAIFIALLGILTSMEYAFGISLGIDNPLFPGATFPSGTAHPGRMAWLTAAGLVMLGTALTFLDSLRWLSQPAALLTGLLGLVGSTCYLYGVDSLRVVSSVPMAIHTVLSFLLLGTGMLFARPRKGILAVMTSNYLGGLAARRILPIAVLAPIIAGWFRLGGERAGMYSVAGGAAFFTTFTVTVLVTIVWLSARSLNAIDARRAGAAIAGSDAALEIERANQRRIESEERFRLYMDHLPGSAFLKDSQGRYLWGNPAWRRQFPAEWGDLIGKKDDDLWPPDTRAVFQASDRKVLEQRAPVELIESGTTGSEISHRMVSKFPIHGPGGELLIGGVAFDITERKQLENQLFQAQKLEAIGLLAGGVAHDFNNLLTVILGFSEEVKLDFEQGKPPYENLREIQGAARKAAALTSQLLAFGRKQVMQPRILDLNESLAEMQRMLRRVLREDIHLQLSLQPDTGRVQADPVQMQQVLINLAMNAQDAMPDGGRITIETSNVDLDESYVVSHRQVQPGPYVLLAISDTGTGMDEETKTRIFEPFFTTKPPGKGTGLGLATVYGIVKQTGGFIWVYSEPGSGTAFKIYLPRVVGQMAAPEAQAAAAPRTGTGRTILVAEDEDSVRMLIIKACTKAGYRLLAATNGEEALSLATSHNGPIDLLLTDVIMPVMNGRALADKVTQLRPETKVLYCSGYAENAIIHHGVLNLQATFLPKPFTATALLQAIREILDETY